LLFPEEMIRVEVIGPKQRLNEIAAIILNFGALEPIDPKYPISQERVDYAKTKVATVSEHIIKVSQIMELGGLVRVPSGKIEDTDWGHLADQLDREARDLESRYSGLLEEVNKIKGELNQVEALLSELEPLSSISIPLDSLYSSQFLEIYVVKGPFDLIQEVKNAGDVFIYAIRQGEKIGYGLIVSYRGNQSMVKALSERGLKRIEIPENLPRSPSEAYAQLSSRKEELLKVLSELKGRAAQRIQTEKDQVLSIYGRLLTLRDALNLISKMRVSDFFAQVEGYTTSKAYRDLERMLKRRLGEDVVVEAEWPKKYRDEEPPTELSLPKALRPLQSIVEIYGTPSYWEFAPTAFLVVTFPVLFALMFPDFGDALLLLIFSVWFWRYGLKRGSNTITNISIVLIYSSIGAMITGLLSRGFFGPLPVGGLDELTGGSVASKGPLYSAWPIPLWVTSYLSPLLPFGEFSSPISISNAIILSVGVGIISLFGSSVIGVVNALKKRDFEYLTYEKLPTLLIYTSPFMIFAYGLVDLPNFFSRIDNLLGQLIPALSSPIPSPSNAMGYAVLWVAEAGLIYNWLGRAMFNIKVESMPKGSALVNGFLEGAFDGAILLLSNTISFIRILVLAMAHYYVLYAFSYMGYLVAGQPASTLAVLASPLAIVILIIGNLLAAGLEGLIVFVQDLRLHFYEMFSKFYNGSGKKFEPVRAYAEVKL